MDWFEFEFKAFISRSLLLTTMIGCVVWLVVIGVSTELAVGAALALLALSIPTYLVHYGLSQDGDEN